jgi:hypothetical protein
MSLCGGRIMRRLTYLSSFGGVPESDRMAAGRCQIRTQAMGAPQVGANMR